MFHFKSKVRKKQFECLGNGAKYGCLLNKNDFFIKGNLIFKVLKEYIYIQID